MPSMKKTLFFLSSALASSISVGILGFGMSTEWSVTNMECARADTNLFNGSVDLTLELFEGNLVKRFCPSFGAPVDFEVFPMLVEVGAAHAALHALSLALLVLCLLFSACSILISLYNSVSNPYETYMGPIGIYVCSSLSACLSTLAIILFVVNVFATGLPEGVVKKEVGDTDVDLQNIVSELGVGFYLVIPYTVLSLVAIAVIYTYDHAAYTQRREQQKPTEDAPKEIMMY